MAKRPERPPPRQEKRRRDSGEQSGSTGRNPGTGDPRDDGANTGQDSYGMNDAGPRAANDDRIDRDPSKKDEDHAHGGNEGSGRYDTEVNGVDPKDAAKPGSTAPRGR